VNNAAAADYATQPAGHKNSDYEMLGQLPVVFKAQLSSEFTSKAAEGVWGM